MPSTAEVEEVVVAVKGDASNYYRMADEVVKKSDHMADQVTTAQLRISAAIGGAIGGAVGSVIGRVVSEIVDSVFDWVKGTEELNRAMAESQRLSEEIGKNMDRNAKRTMEMANTFVNPKEKEDFLELSLKHARKELEGMKQEMSGLEQQIGGHGWLSKQFGSADSLKQDLEDVKKRLKDGRDHVRQLGEEIGKFHDEELITLKHKHQIDEFTQSLKEQLLFMGKSSAEAKLMKMEMDGIGSPEQLAQARQYADALQNIKDREEEVKEAAKQAAEEEKKWQSILKEGEQVRKSVMTPMEKYKEEVDRLGKLLYQDAISPETYDRAVKKAKEALDKLPKVKTIPIKFDVAEFGGAEYFTRLQHQMEIIEPGGSDGAAEDKAADKVRDAIKEEGEKQRAAEAKQQELLKQMVDIAKSQSIKVGFSLGVAGLA